MAGVVMGLLAPVDQLERLEHRLHAWSGFVIVPVFALANAGIELTADAVDRAWSSSVTLGVVAGLVVGKAVGIAGTTWAVVRLGWADVPSGANRRQLLGVAALSGVGFTVSLFITGLAFDAPTLVDDAKIGVLAASVLATIVGGALLRVVRSPAKPAGG
jgi:NhaA family Na+:H+ antiporter